MELGYLVPHFADLVPLKRYITAQPLPPPRTLRRRILLHGVEGEQVTEGKSSLLGRPGEGLDSSELLVGNRIKWINRIKWTKRIYVRMIYYNRGFLPRDV